jgi:hypothetical protein
VSAPGRGAPGGGIIPARSLRIIFSAVSARSEAFSTWKVWKVWFPVSIASM